jgi:hypothetical protein
MNKKKVHTLTVGAMIVLSLCLVSFTMDAEASTGGIIYVPAPTGVPEDDWANIQQALDAMMPGDTVQLAAGTYLVHKPLIKTSMSGSFVGAGKDVTVIEAVRASNGDPFAVIHAFPWDDFDFPGSQMFVTTMFYLPYAENCFFADMAFEINQAGISEESYILDTVFGDKYYIDVWGTNLGVFFELEAADGCISSFESVRMTGTPNQGFWGNPVHGVIINGDFGGVGSQHSVRNSHFEYMGSYCYGGAYITGAEFVVESNGFSDTWRGVQFFGSVGLDVKVSDNHFEDLLLPAVVNWDLDSSLVEVTRNTMVNVRGGVWTWQEYVSQGSSILIEHNDIDLRDFSDWGAVEIWDWVPTKSEFVVSHNKIHGRKGIGPYSPIGLLGVHDAAFTNNIITGSGIAAAFIGVYPLECVGVTFLGNNFQGWEVTDGFWENDFVPGVAAIILGGFSRQCTIVGGSNKVNVVDWGIDNIIVGVNNMGNTGLGQAIRDAMNQRNELKQELMHEPSGFPV